MIYLIFSGNSFTCLSKLAKLSSALHGNPSLLLTSNKMMTQILLVEEEDTDDDDKDGCEDELGPVAARAVVRLL